MLKFEIKGQSEIVQNLRSLSRGAAQKAGEEAVRAAVSPMVMRAKATAPKDTGALRASIGVRFKKYRKGNLMYAVVGAKYDSFDTAKGRRVPGNYAHLVEFGHALLRGADGKTGMKALKGKSLRKKTATARASVTPRPFMRPAWEATKGEVLETLGRVFGEKVEAAAIQRARRRRSK